MDSEMTATERREFDAWEWAQATKRLLNTHEGLALFHHMQARCLDVNDPTEDKGALDAMMFALVQVFAPDE